MLEKKQISQSNLSVTRFEMFFEEIGLAADAAHASKLYLEFLAHGADLIDGAENLILSLKKLYKLVLITNGLKSVQRPRFAKAPIIKHFSEIIISEEVGYTKPHKEIFDITFQRMATPAKEKVLMIGDNPGSDILGGINYGIDTCWYNPTGLISPAGIIPTYEVKNFNELRTLLI